jgi:hypothetical protein
MMATLPAYKLEWETGVDKMLLVSIGTGRVRTGIGLRRADQMSLLFHARSLPIALMDSINLQQDMICRTIGYCRAGEPIDSEVGDFRDVAPDEILKRKFTYMRYDHPFTDTEIKGAKQYGKSGLSLDNLRLIPFLQQIGREYAEEHVRAEDLL